MKCSVKYFHSGWKSFSARNKTSSHLNQNALAFGSKHQGVLKKLQGLFLKPLDVFVWSSGKTRIGHARRVMNFMLEDERSSCYICTIFISRSELQELQTAWYWTCFLWSSVVNILSNCNCYPSCLQPPGLHLMILPAVRRRNFIRKLHTYQPDIQ